LPCAYQKSQAPPQGVKQFGNPSLPKSTVKPVLAAMNIFLFVPSGFFDLINPLLRKKQHLLLILKVIIFVSLENLSTIPHFT
jgi:hypothetical protein